MWTGAGRLAGMAGGAFIQGSRITLQIDKLDSVDWFTTGGNGMRAVMTTGAVHIAMAFGHTIQGLVLLVDATVTLGIITARLVEPWLWVLRNLAHPAVTIDTVHIVLG